MKSTLDDFVWNGAIELPAGLTREYMENLEFLPNKERIIWKKPSRIRGSVKWNRSQ